MRTPSRTSVLVWTVMLLAGFRGARAQRPTVVDTLEPSDSALVAYIRTLRFLRDHVSSDERPLDWTLRARREVARLEPVASAYSDTTRGGRVVARIVNLGDPVSRFGLYARGITYLWIQADRDPKYAVYISTDSTGRIVHRGRAKLLPSDSTVHLAEIRSPLARFRMTPAPLLRADAICTWQCDSGPWCSADTLFAFSFKQRPTTPRRSPSR